MSRYELNQTVGIFTIIKVAGYSKYPGGVITLYEVTCNVCSGNSIVMDTNMEQVSRCVNCLRLTVPDQDKSIKHPGIRKSR
jgi:hypothetical protein